MLNICIMLLMLLMHAKKKKKDSRDEGLMQIRVLVSLEA